jgi:catalase
VLFDAVALVMSSEGAKMLTGVNAALDFVSDAYAHCKAIGYTEEAKALMQKGGVQVDDWIMPLPADATNLVMKVAERNWDREGM